MAEHWSCKPGDESSILSGGRKLLTSVMRNGKKAEIIGKKAEINGEKVEIPGKKAYINRKKAEINGKKT